MCSRVQRLVAYSGGCKTFCGDCNDKNNNNSNKNNDNVNNNTVIIICNYIYLY